jgi:hypothetical protein
MNPRPIFTLPDPIEPEDTAAEAYKALNQPPPAKVDQEKDANDE